MNHHCRRSGTKFGEPLRRRRSTAHQLAEQHARMQVGDHRALRLDALAVASTTALATPLAMVTCFHRRIELHLATGCFDGANHRRYDRGGATLPERHAENSG